MSCHDIHTITDKRKSPEDWAATVARMAGRGAEVTPQEMTAIEDYLIRNYPASPQGAGNE